MQNYSRHQRSIQRHQRRVQNTETFRGSSVKKLVGEEPGCKVEIIGAVGYNWTHTRKLQGD